MRHLNRTKKGGERAYLQVRMSKVRKLCHTLRVIREFPRCYLAWFLLYELGAVSAIELASPHTAFALPQIPRSPSALNLHSTASGVSVVNENAIGPSSK